MCKYVMMALRVKRQDAAILFSIVPDRDPVLIILKVPLPG
jgi:hypothetical protein